jgi:hypothetical protein
MAFDLFEEFVALADALDAGGVPYALCGGLAVAVHGYARATRDLDLLIQEADIPRAKEIARALGFTAESLPMKFRATGTMHRVIKIAHSGEVLMLDLLVVGETLAPVWEARETRPLQGHSISVVSRPGLVSMKITAGRPQDLVDVQKLAELD